MAAALATPLRTLRQPLNPTGLIVRSNGDTVIHLAEAASPIEPFIPDRDPAVWLLPSDRTDLRTGDDGVPVLETLVALGHTEDGAWVFVDLESGVRLADGTEAKIVSGHSARGHRSVYTIRWLGGEPDEQTTTGRGRRPAV